MALGPEADALIRDAYRFVVGHPGATLREIGDAIGLPEDAHSDRITISAFGRVRGVLRTVKDPDTLLDRFYVIGEGA